VFRPSVLTRNRIFQLNKPALEINLPAGGKVALQVAVR